MGMVMEVHHLVWEASSGAGRTRSGIKYLVAVHYSGPATVTKQCKDQSLLTKERQCRRTACPN